MPLVLVFFLVATWTSYYRRCLSWRAKYLSGLVLARAAVGPPARAAPVCAATLLAACAQGRAGMVREMAHDIVLPAGVACALALADARAWQLTYSSGLA